MLHFEPIYYRRKSLVTTTLTFKQRKIALLSLKMGVDSKLTINLNQLPEINFYQCIHLYCTGKERQNDKIYATNTKQMILNQKQRSDDTKSSIIARGPAIMDDFVTLHHPLSYLPTLRPKRIRINHLLIL